MLGWTQAGWCSRELLSALASTGLISATACTSGDLPAPPPVSALPDAWTKPAHERRLNEAMLEVLDRGGRVAVSVVLGATVDVDDDVASLDLTVKSARRLVESAAETSARLEGLAVANL